MADKHKCIWCGRSEDEVGKLFAGPVLRLCAPCVKSLAGAVSGDEARLSEQVKQEIDAAVQESFGHMVTQLNLGPLQDKYQRLVRVKFKEEPGSPTFQEVFLEFKKGVEAEVAPDDYQTRYDLAIAYHEMGLSEDAFREMMNSLRESLRGKDFDRASEIISALIYFHQDSERVIKGIFRVMSEPGAE